MLSSQDLHAFLLATSVALPSGTRPSRYGWQACSRLNALLGRGKASTVRHKTQCGPPWELSQLEHDPTHLTASARFLLTTSLSPPGSTSDVPGGTPDVSTPDIQMSATLSAAATHPLMPSSGPESVDAPECAHTLPAPPRTTEGVPEGPSVPSVRHDKRFPSGGMGSASGRLAWASMRQTAVPLAPPVLRTCAPYGATVLSVADRPPRGALQAPHREDQARREKRYGRGRQKRALTREAYETGSFG